MKVYIASRWSLEFRPMLHELRDWLHKNGHVVTSRWLDCMRPYGKDQQLLEDSMCDAGDVRRAQWVLKVYPTPGHRSRGGHQHEFGMGLAWGHRLTLIGEPLHVFDHMPQVERFVTIEEFKLAEAALDRPT